MEMFRKPCGLMLLTAGSRAAPAADGRTVSRGWGCSVRSWPDPLLPMLGTLGWLCYSVGPGKRQAPKKHASSCSFTTSHLLPGCHHAVSFLPGLNQPLPSILKAAQQEPLNIPYYLSVRVSGARFLIENHPLGRPGLERVNYLLPGSLHHSHKGAEPWMVGTGIWFDFPFPCQAPDLEQELQHPHPWGRAAMGSRSGLGVGTPSSRMCASACACTLRSASFGVCTAH